jgi:succinate dehydrogenase / fumarate reductase membrane anchor subunit
VKHELRTPLARVRGLGSAKSGTGHFWLQRLTAISNAVLVVFLLWLVFALVGKDYATVKETLQRPLITLPLLLLILSGTVHMRLGMQSIIEDYVHAEGRKLLALMLNTFFAILVGLALAWAVLKLSFGA